MATDAVTATIPCALNLSDIDTTISGEPRILDIRLAEALGYERPADIRPMIERHVEALERLGGIIRTVRKNVGRGRPANECWLTKRQAIYIAAKSETDRAVEITIQVVEVFDAVTSGRPLGAEPTVPVAAHRRRPPLARTDDVSRLAALVDRIEAASRPGPDRDGLALVRLGGEVLLVNTNIPKGFSGTALIIDRYSGALRLSEVTETSSPLAQMMDGARTALAVYPNRPGRWPCQVVGVPVEKRSAGPATPPATRETATLIAHLRTEIETSVRRVMDDATLRHLTGGST